MATQTYGSAPARIGKSVGIVASRMRQDYRMKQDERPPRKAEPKKRGRK